MEFEINICPICYTNLVCTVFETAKHYFCPQKFYGIKRTGSSFENRQSHYKVTVQQNFQDIQAITAYPYYIEITNTVLVYKYVQNNFSGMNFLFQLPNFKIVSEDVMRQKIESLIPFI